MTDQEMRKRIEAVLEEVRPNIQMDGGDVRFVRFQDGIMYIRLEGACIGCSASSYTLKLGIEETVRQHIPEVREVVALENEEE